MKKSVIIMILIIYVASIVFIGFFGMKIASYNETLYVDHIECTNEEAVQYTGFKYVIIDYATILEGDMNTNVFQLQWKVYPEDATYRGVSFVYDENTTVGYVTNIGTVVFNKKGTITIYITSTDGQNIREIVKIVAM